MSPATKGRRPPERTTRHRRVGRLTVFAGVAGALLQCDQGEHVLGPPARTVELAAQVAGVRDTTLPPEADTYIPLGATGAISSSGATPPRWTPSRATCGTERST
jgi:hypothetical protein